ncbi:DUF6292 family protein [Amycolatopsis albispora]|uniref:DUF6292 domain-containing protein n=1 Tax=Amycolatopsis albispora TaxID=1804986 RepID=A0A344L6V1_9PSEU|nr:DUF6292 family protein [Amycolatopsis albispora]AXB43775.1 hypothetical protein A4R43_15620 [Amycolatopsis albispora]
MVPLLETDFEFTRALRAYTAAVGSACGAGPESCTVDTGTPASAYIALDGRLRRYPDRDVALVWDERHGWALAVETHSAEDLLIVCYLGHKLLARPAEVARFAAKALSGRPGLAEPPQLREAGAHDWLTDRLRPYVTGLLKAS